MMTLSELRKALVRTARVTLGFQECLLTDSQYNAGFEIQLQGLGWTAYKDSVAPTLLQLMAFLLNSDRQISVLEVGPGSKSYLSWLPNEVRKKIKTYSAYELIKTLAASLERSLTSIPSSRKSCCAAKSEGYFVFRLVNVNEFSVIS